MKKRIFLVAALVLLVLMSGFADGSTWTNPDEAPFLGALSLPRSMMSAVSNGIYYDEVDTIILSPAELSNYSGYSIITAYGNYEYDYNGDPAYVPFFVNPFTTGGLNQIGPGAEIGNFLLGATGELFGFRSGLIASFNITNTERLDMAGLGTADASAWEELETVTVDADGDGTVDFTYSTDQTYTDYTTSTVINMGAGVDLEFLGASLYGSFDNTVNLLGGSYVYTKAINADTDSVPSADPVDVITSNSITFGFGEDGKVKNNPLVTSTDWILGARAHLPLEIADFSMPVKADFYVGGLTPTFGGIGVPTNFNLTATNVTADDVTETSTISAVYGESEIDGTFDVNAAIGTVGTGLDTYTQANFNALITFVEGGGIPYALNSEDIRNFNLKTGFKGLIDPKFIINDVLSLRTRGQLGYELDITSQKGSGIKSVVYNEALVGQTAKAVYNWSETASGTFGTTVNTIDLELGGLMELHNRENTIGVTSGLFYQPEFVFTGNTQKDLTIVETISYVDPANTTPDATAIGQNVGIGSVQGTQTITSVSGAYGDNGLFSSSVQITNTFYIPTSVRVGFAKGALEFVGGYLLKHDNSTTTTKTYDQANGTLTTSLVSAGGTDYSDPAPTSVANTVTTDSETVLNTIDPTWAGQMSFMLRWNAMENMTVDLFGSSLMTALNFGIFGGAGFNPSTFLGSLGMSVTISME